MAPAEGTEETEGFPAKGWAAAAAKGWAAKGRAAAAADTARAAAAAARPLGAG